MKPLFPIALGCFAFGLFLAASSQEAAAAVECPPPAADENADCAKCTTKPICIACCDVCIFNGCDGQCFVPCLVKGPIEKTVDSTDSGGYDETGSHSAGNTGYVVGDSSILSPPDDIRDFFVFDLLSVTTTIVTAELRLVNPANGYISGDATEDYDLFDVSTPIATLLAGGSGLTAIHSDLGTGSTYGGKTVSSADNGTTVVVPLNAAFVSAANATSGQIAIGGALTTLDGLGATTEHMFSGSAGMPLSDVQLVLSVTEESRVPTLSIGGLAVFLILLAGGALVVWRRRARTMSG